jgi:hypothetical protein
MERALVCSRDVGVELDLVDVGRHTCLVEQPLHVCGREVGDPDGAHLAGVQQVDHPSPRVDVAVVTRVRPVDEQQIDHVHPQELRAARPRLLGTVDTVPLTVELGGDEHLVPVDVTRPDPTPDTTLIAVALGRVDQPIAGGEGLGDRCLGLRVVEWPGAEAEHRHGDAVGQRDGRCFAHSLPRPQGRWQARQHSRADRSHHVEANASPAVRCPGWQTEPCAVGSGGGRG